MLGGEVPSSWRSAFLLEKLGGQEESTEEGDTEEESGGVPPFEAVRTETHKYVEYENGEKELYDLEADPYELENIIDGADPSLVDNLKARLDALRSCASDGCREAEDAS